MSDPNVLDHKPLPQGNVPGKDYSVANIDNRNVAAQAGNAAAKVAGDNQKMGVGGTISRTGKESDPSVIERIVAEERESQGKLPRYPGLERWTLLEKMGDGAFSNVYRAREANGQGAEVAIKVVRKFEMNSNQVSVDHAADRSISHTSFTLRRATLLQPYGRPRPHANATCCIRAPTAFIRILKSNLRLWRCA